MKKILWGISESCKKINLVKWSNITKPKKEGGLGIQCLTAKNHALLASILQRLFHAQNSLWVVFLRNKYLGRSPNSAYTSSVWKNLMLGWKYRQNDIIQQPAIGRNINFWNYPWIKPRTTLRSMIYGLLTEFKQCKCIADCRNDKT